METTTISQFVRNADRFREVVSILAKHGLADWIAGSAPSWLVSIVTTAREHLDAEHAGQDLTTAQRLRVALTELGTTFIKLGQILSTRPDLVGQEFADELAELRTNTPADSPDAVRQVVESELGDSIETFFAEFDYVPMASASIGQVHRARLHSGERVAVKVQHPGIEHQIINDLEIVGKLAAIAERHSAQLQQFRPVRVTREFSQTLTRELDFVRERTNAETFCRNFRNDPMVRFAMPFPELCSRRVLTMELLEGITISDKLELQRSQLDLDDLARRGAKIFLDMIFRDGFYHADPHPGQSDGDRRDDA